MLERELENEHLTSANINGIKQMIHIALVNKHLTQE